MRVSAEFWLACGVLLCTGCGPSLDRQAAALTGGDPKAGIAAALRYGCGSCHTIPRVPGANGQVGPSLASIGSRRFIAGELPNTPDNMVHWVRHPQEVNNRTAMPELGVTMADARDIAALLSTLNHQP